MARQQDERRRKDQGNQSAPGQRANPDQSLVGAESPDDLEDMEIGAIPSAPDSPAEQQRQRERQQRPTRNKGRLP